MTSWSRIVEHTAPDGAKTWWLDGSPFEDGQQVLAYFNLDLICYGTLQTWRDGRPPSLYANLPGVGFMDVSADQPRGYVRFPSVD